MKRGLYQLASSILIVLLSACGSNAPLVFDLMPAPAAFTETGIKSADESDHVKKASAYQIFYATDRMSAKPDDSKHFFYTNERGTNVRIGRASVMAGKDDLTWSEVRNVSLLKSRSEKFPIKVKAADEYGVLSSSINRYTQIEDHERAGADKATRRYINEINEHLKNSDNDTINIFVHGYKVTFENPVLTTAEMWHFLAYEGVFIAYSWPSTPKALAYVSDTETALVSSRNLRDLIRFLASSTNTKRINIIGYSAGSRLVSRTLGDLAIQEHGKTREEIQQKLKLGTVAIIAGDVDRRLMGGYLLDGADRLMKQLVIYQSDSDKALSLSNWLTSRNRLGQAFDLNDLNKVGVQYLLDNPQIVIVDVSNAEAARAGNGHGYLRKSPWVTSDLLIALMENAAPQKRGLVRKQAGVPLWTFPSDYTQRLKSFLKETRPSLFE
ncbi:alpha/beta hydrolase [Rubritalea marina]|uniref:alpha/beta hydrolase n=1 Tax=Rubritalea marina TaxID=361055 RepID=UPI00035DA032|nr:alpha/beta hydrolase [Rubritalea marina]